MFQSICDFTRLAGSELADELENEFQYQMDLSDGEFLIWESKTFRNITVEPAKCVQAQAILQYFAGCGCAFSLLRLGRSLAARNCEHGPITSDSFALKHLLKGFEIIDNNMYCKKLQAAMILLINSDEFRLACELTLSFEKELGQRVICPEVERLIRHNTTRRKRRLQ